MPFTAPGPPPIAYIRADMPSMGRVTTADIVVNGEGCSAEQLLTSVASLVRRGRPVYIASARPEVMRALVRAHGARVQQARAITAEGAVIVAPGSAVFAAGATGWLIQESQRRGTDVVRVHLPFTLDDAPKQAVLHTPEEVKKAKKAAKKARKMSAAERQQLAEEAIRSARTVACWSAEWTRRRRVTLLELADAGLEFDRAVLPRGSGLARRWVRAEDLGISTVDHVARQRGTARSWALRTGLRTASERGWNRTLRPKAGRVKRRVMRAVQSRQSRQSV